MKDNRNMLKLSTNAGFSKIKPFNFVFQKLSQNRIICDGPVLLSVTIMNLSLPTNQNIIGNARHVILKAFLSGSRYSPLH